MSAWSEGLSHTRLSQDKTAIACALGTHDMQDFGRAAAGWAYAEATPADSVALCGAFLHAGSLRMQAEVARMQEQMALAERQRLPQFYQVIPILQPLCLSRVQCFGYLILGCNFPAPLHSAHVQMAVMLFGLLSVVSRCLSGQDKRPLDARDSSVREQSVAAV